jgi:hypothetical protein
MLLSRTQNHVNAPINVDNITKTAGNALSSADGFDGFMFVSSVGTGLLKTIGHVERECKRRFFPCLI